MLNVKSQKTKKLPPSESLVSDEDELALEDEESELLDSSSNLPRLFETCLFSAKREERKFNL